MMILTKLSQIAKVTAITEKNVAYVEAPGFKLTMVRRDIPDDHPNPPFTWAFDESRSSQPTIAAHFSLRYLCHYIMNKKDIMERSKRYMQMNRRDK